MHDLHTIHKLNAEAYAQGIENFRKQGRHVLAVYSGLHLMSVETFGTAEEATAALEAIPANCGDHGKVFAPYPTTAAIVTDGAGDTGPSEVDPYLTTR